MSAARKLHARRGARKVRDWRPRFLEALADLGVIRLACESAGVARRTAYDAREAEEEFARAWDEAIEQGVDVLEAAARTRALGTSDQLLIHLLKAHRPQVHSDRLRAELTGKDGAPIAVDVKAQATLEAETLEALRILEDRLTKRPAKAPVARPAAAG